MCAAALILIAGAAEARPMDQFPSVDDSSFTEPSGDRVIALETTVSAAPAEVWRALSTAEGWKSFAVKMAAVDFRVGGMIETSYDPAAKPGLSGNIKNEILAFLPERLLVIRNVQAPPGFAHAESFARTTTAIELIPADRGTTVRLTAVGFRPGADFDDLLKMFTMGDAWTLDELRKRFASEAPAPLPLVPDAPRMQGHPAVQDSSRVLDDGSRMLQHSIVIHAPATTLWKAFTDIDTYKAWATPVADIDMRVGGHLEAAYDPKGHIGDPDNIRHDILAYAPGRMIVFRNVQAPAGLPGGAVYGQTRIVVSYADAGGGDTRVTVSGVGYGDGPEFDRLYGFFHEGNAGMLESLKTAFEAKPTPTAKAN
jgi:uncharacterized protein YndB with AHSA1/START domain